MDHLVLDSDGQSHLFEVPVHDLTQYDGLGFDGYLERLGISQATLLRHLQENHEQGTGVDAIAMRPWLASIVQEWLFVAFAIDMFHTMDIDLHRDSLIKLEDGEQYLTTLALPLMAVSAFSHASCDTVSPLALEAYLLLQPEQKLAYERSLYQQCLMQSKQAIGCWSADNQARRRARVKHLTDTVRNFLRLSFTAMITVDPLTWMASMVMLESLGELSFKLYHVPQDDEGVRLDRLTWWASFCKDRGICPARATKVCDVGTFSDAIIGCSLNIVQTLDHSNCVYKVYCKADNFVKPCPSHRKDCDGQCELLSLSLHDKKILRLAIESKSWGLIRFENSRSDSASFRMVAGTANDSSFVALSHVWSHGLGNPNENAIWTCQMLRLKHALHEAACDGADIWLDPLCIPLDDDLKMTAIGQMSDIYSHASKTLVLDLHLEQRAGPRILKVAHILMSDWMTRIWTLQEALLPRDKLCFLFKDGVFSVDDILAHDLEHQNFEMHRTVIASMLRNPLATYMRQGAKEDRLLSLVESFHDRSTTVASDESICLAILCGLDPAELPTRARLHHVLQRLELVPQDLIYAPGPRSKEPGFRWSPQSLLRQPQAKLYLPRQRMVQRDRRGICMSKDGARFAKAFWFEPILAGTSDYRHYKLFEDAEATLPYRVMVLDEVCLEVQEQIRPRNLAAAAMIIEKSFEDNTTSAILVSGLRYDNDGDMRAKYEARMWLLKPARFSNQDGNSDQLETHPCMDLVAPMTNFDRLWVD